MYWEGEEMKDNKQMSTMKNCPVIHKPSPQVNGIEIRNQGGTN